MVLVHADRIGTRATRFEDCAYQCACGDWAYSNATNPAGRRLIARLPELNVPPNVREGLDDVLAQAANVRNRPTKRFKFASERSEDAVTWTVFRVLEREGLLGRIARGVGRPAMLLWGVPVGAGDGAPVAAELESVSADLGERGRTEPDVVIAWDDLVVLVEAKYGSRNDRQSGYRGFPRYLDRADLFRASADEVTEAGWYELTRNWRVGAELAERLERRFLLVNLGPPALERDRFADLIAQAPDRTFVHRRWVDLVQAVPALDEYARQRALGRA